MLFFVAYIFGSYEDAGVSVWVLLLTLLYISAMALKELFDGKIKVLLLCVALIIWVALMLAGGRVFLLLGVYLGYEFFLAFNAGPYLYFSLYPVLFVPGSVDPFFMLIVIALLHALYYQYSFVVVPYREQMYEETVTQQDLKRDIERRESAAKEAHRKSMLLAENKILEERASLSQTLHDKLGHNINGSIYQLEASKVIMDKEPEKAKAMLQAVIDQLRTGMDEIRAILRKERPEKKKLALLQLHELCADCINKGVQAELNMEGDMSKIPDDLWEVILDNIFEAVTNSLKYSRCKRIDIGIIVLNKMIRCTVTDDGAGCDNIVDGMGLSGMRKRVREAGGTIDFESTDINSMDIDAIGHGTEHGFKVSMLLPLE